MSADPVDAPIRSSVRAQTPLRVLLFGCLVLATGLLVHGGAKLYDDAAIDRVVVEAAWDGVDPYQPVSDLYEHVGIHTEPTEAVIPRTPAFFLIQAPTLVVPVRYAGVLNLVLAAVALPALCLLSGRASGFAFGLWPLLVLVSSPVLGALHFGNIVFVYMTLIVWALAGSEGWRGVPLGIAAAARLWPGLIVIGLWFEGKRKPAVVAGVVAIGLNLGGLLLPSVTLPGAIDGLTKAAAFFGDDISLPGPAYVWPFVMVALVLLVRRVDVAVVSGILASPISWLSYYLAALPTIMARRAWIPALLIGISDWLGRWLAAVGGVWLLVLLVRSSWQTRIAESATPS